MGGVSRWQLSAWFQPKTKARSVLRHIVEQSANIALIGMQLGFDQCQMP
jgi:hypothetical protein